MKYSAIFFDWGDTLSVVKNHVPYTNSWIKPMIQKLYRDSYRLAIISNTHRYQDSHWIKQELIKANCLAEFEVVISSAMYGKHKPNLDIFQKALDFMEVTPSKVLMVGDSEHCDGACQFLNMNYFSVKSGDDWSQKLFQILEDSNYKNRKLSRIKEFGLFDDRLIVKIRHLSESIFIGDSILLDEEEYLILGSNRPFLTKADVLSSTDDFVEFKVRKLED